MAGPWVIGALVNNVWSVSEDGNRGSVNQLLAQPFINYNFPSSPGRYLTFSPIITANWEAENGDKWLVPLGLGIGQITRFGKQAVNLQSSFYYNVDRPDDAPEDQVRLQLQLPVSEVIQKSFRGSAGLAANNQRMQRLKSRRNWPGKSPL